MDYYEILGLPKNATEDEIKKSYRKLAMKHHPDRNAGNKKSEDEFKKINTAYSILSDPIKRENYDFQNSIGKNGSFSQSSSFNNNEDISDFMKNVFGNRNPFNDFFEEQFHHRRPTRKTYNVHLNFWEAAFGVQKEFEIIDDNGNRKSFNISFPAGLDDGITLEVGMSNHPSLYLSIHVEPDPYFTRDNLDLHTTIELPMSKAVLGGVMKFPHWNHDYEVTIPPGTQHGQTLRLSNAGIKKDIFVGDLYLKCKIVMPKKLNKKQTELMEAFAKTEKENPSIFDNLKSSWNKFFKKDVYEQ